MVASPYSGVRLRRAAAHFVGGRVVQALSRAALLLLVVRLLPAADYGAYMLVIGIAEMLLQLFSFGLLPVGQRFLPQLVEHSARRDIVRFVTVLLLAQLVILLAVGALFWWLWAWLLPWVGFSAEQIESTRPAVALFLLVPLFRFFAELLEALLEQGRAQVARALMPLGRLAGLLLLIALGTSIGLPQVLLVDGVVTLVCLALAWWFLTGSLRRLDAPAEPQPLPMAAMRRHAKHMALVGVLGASQQPGAIRLVLANALGIVESGLFAFLQSLQRLVGRYLPGVLLRGLVRPMLISRSVHREGMALVEHGVALLTKFNLLFIAAAAVIVFLGGDWIVDTASGGKFPDAGDTLLLMLLALVCISQREVVDMIMQVMNQTHVLRLTALLAPVTLAAVWASAAYADLNAAIIVYAAGAGVANLLNMWRLRASTERFAIDWQANAGILLAAVAAAVAGSLVLAEYGPWFAFPAAGLLLLTMLVMSKPFAIGELQLADRGLGRVGRLVLQPFVRKGVA